MGRFQFFQRGEDAFHSTNLISITETLLKVEEFVGAILA